MIVLEDFWYSADEQAFNFVYADNSRPSEGVRIVHTSFKTTVKGALKEVRSWMPNVVIPPSFSNLRLPCVNTEKVMPLFQ